MMASALCLMSPAVVAQTSTCRARWVATDCIALPPAGLYQPIWEYDAKTSPRN